MKASGEQLQQITRLIDSGAIRSVIDRVFTFDQTQEALAYVETGRAKGKVVIKNYEKPREGHADFGIQKNHEWWNVVITGERAGRIKQRMIA